MQFIPTNTQVNDAINQMTAFVEGVLPQKEAPAPYAFAKVASTTSQKMMKAQSRDDHSVSSSSAGDTGSSTDISEDREESECTYDWDDVMEQIKYNPSLAKVDVDGILPLHAACGAGAPIDTIKLLIDMYPAAAQAKCGKGYLPIFYHLALITESPSEDVISTLLDAYPGSAAVVDPDNQLPIHLACKAKGVSEKIFTMLLVDHPNGAFECDADGKFPVDYATANTDAATKETALSALLPNDPMEFKKRYVDVVPKMYAQEEIEVSLKPAVKLARSNGSAVSQASNKSSSVDSSIVAVTRSPSNISVKSQLSKKSPEEVDEEVAEVPMARSRSNVSVKSQLSKKSCKSVKEEEEGEEEVADVPVARSRSNFSIKSFASKKSPKSVEEDVVEVPVVRSPSNFSIKSLVSRKSGKVDEEEDVIEEDEVAEEEKEVVAEIPVARSRSNVSVKSRVSTKSAKPTEEDVAEIPVARSQSNVSVKSLASKKSVQQPVARSPSNVSIKSQLSKKSTKAVDEVEKEEEEESPVSGETSEAPPQISDPNVPSEEIAVVSDEKVEEAVEKSAVDVARPKQSFALKSFKSVSTKAKGLIASKWKRKN